MRKVLAGIVSVLVVAGIAVPYVNGIVVEKIVQRSHQNLTQLKSDTGSDVTVEIVKYDRKFSSSEIEWKIKLGGNKDFLGSQEIVFVDRAKHGYFGVVTATSLEKNEWFTDFVRDKLGDKNPLHITTEFKLTGDIQSNVSVEQFSFHGDDEVVEVREGGATINFDEELENFKSEVRWGGLSLPGVIMVDAVALTSKLEKISTYLWSGKNSFVIGNSKLEEEGAGEVQLVNLKGENSLSVDGEKNSISLKGDFGFDNLISGEQRVNDGFCRIGVSGIDAEGYEDVIKLSARKMNEVMEAIADAEIDPDRLQSILEEKAAELGIQMMAAYEKLLKKGLTVEISDLQAKLPAGEVQGDVSVTLTRDMTFTEFAPILFQPKQALNIFTLQSDISLPAKLVGVDNSMFVAPLYSGMQTGLFILDGEKLVHKAETREAKLFLNDHEVLF